MNTDHPNPPVQIVHHPVKRRQVNRLDYAHIVERHVKILLRERPQLASGKACAAEGAQIVAIGPVDGAQHVGAVAGAADGNEQVAGLRKVFQLLDENAVKPFVISPSKDIRRVVG
jgi:hypothetical protein